MANSKLLERSGLEVSIESSEMIPNTVIEQVKETMDEITRLLAGPPDLTAAEINLELFTLVTKLVRLGKNAASDGGDIAVKLAKDKQGVYTRLVAVLTQNKRTDLQKKVDEERAAKVRAQQQTQSKPQLAISTAEPQLPAPLPSTNQSNHSGPGPLSPLSPTVPPPSSSLPSPPASTISGPSSPDKVAAAMRKRKSPDGPTPNERPLKKSASSSSIPPRAASVATPPPGSPRPCYSQRTFPAKVIKSTAFPRFYRRFPVSSYYAPPGTESPCELFNVPHPGGEYTPVRDPFDLYAPRFVESAGGDRRGLCPICIEPPDRGGEGKAVWLPLRTPVYQNHMQLYHGISALTGRPFSPPTRVSILYEHDAANHRRTTEEGKCHNCNEWITLRDHQDHQETDTEDENPLFVHESLWWSHAARCHRDMIEGETDVFEDDRFHITLKTKILAKDDVNQQAKEEQREAEPSNSQNKSTTSKGKGATRKRSRRDSEGYCSKLCSNHQKNLQMIMCEDKDCNIVWFHLKCVGLAAPPPGNWYCDTCKQKRSSSRADRGMRRAGYIRPDIVQKAKLLATKLADKKPGEEVVPKVETTRY